MIESLRIKCPSCGIVLDVRNSKNEATKRIVCPNCKKLLAVDFREERPSSSAPKPLAFFFYGAMQLPLQEGVNQMPLSGSDRIRVTMVRLNDGNYKCVVKNLTADGSVLVNSQSVAQDDEIVLADGDELKFGDVVLTYNKKGASGVSQPSTPEPAPNPNPAGPPTPQHTPKRNFVWIGIVPIVAIAFLLAATMLKSSKHSGQKEPVKPKPVIEKPIEPQKPSPKGTGTVCPPPSPTKYETYSDYELEYLAGKGDSKAQYELGTRWINQKDSINIVKGVSYLKQAASGGSSEAKSALRVLNSKLEQAANNGNPHARNLLEVIK